MSIRHARVGFDMGRVIAEFLQGKKSHEAKETFLEVGPNPHAFEVIAESVTEYGPANNFIISRCGDVVREMIIQWLRHHDFYRATGFDEANVLFTYTCEEKAVVADALEGGPLTHFVDDSVRVLQPMNVRQKILFGPQPSGFVVPSGMVRAKDWPAVRQPLGLA